jgi:hypothetical protein
MAELEIIAGGDMECLGTLTDKTDKTGFVSFVSPYPGRFLMRWSPRSRFCGGG